MKFNHDGKQYELHREPLTRAVEAVMMYDQLLLLSCIDMGALTEEDKRKDINLVLQEQLFKSPEKMARYLAKQRISEHVRTVILCTGKSYDEVLEVPLRPLFEECKKVMGGTARDFFGEFLPSSIPDQTPTTRESCDCGTSCRSEAGI